MSRFQKLLTAIAVAVLFAPLTFASNLANDNASAWAYNAGWVTGMNGGFGFGPWTLTAGAGGHFIWTSTGNSLPDDGITGGVPIDNDIDTAVGPVPDQSGDPDPNVTVFRSWGMWNAGAVTDAVRPFTGALEITQHVTVDFDNGNVPTGATVGIGLQNAAGQNLWELYFVGGGALYQNNDAAGQVATTVPWGDEGLHVDFVLTGANTYSVTLTRRDGVTWNGGGNLMNPTGGQAITQFRAFDAGNQQNDASNFYVNRLAIIPDPPTVGMVVMGLLGAGAFLRRRMV